MAQTLDLRSIELPGETLRAIDKVVAAAEAAAKEAAEAEAEGEPTEPTPEQVAAAAEAHAAAVAAKRKEVLAAANVQIDVSVVLKVLAGPPDNTGDEGAANNTAEGAPADA